MCNVAGERRQFLRVVWHIQPCAHARCDYIRISNRLHLAACVSHGSDTLIQHAKDLVQRAYVGHLSFVRAGRELASDTGVGNLTRFLTASPPIDSSVQPARLHRDE
jgi:hypothetical protein